MRGTRRDDAAIRENKTPGKTGRCARGTTLLSI